MRLAVAATMCLVLFVNYEISSSKPITNIKSTQLKPLKHTIEARQFQTPDDEYFYDDEQEQHQQQEVETRQPLSELNYDGAKTHDEFLSDENDFESESAELDDEEDEDESPQLLSHANGKKPRNSEEEQNGDYNQSDEQKDYEEAKEEEEEEEEEEDDDDVVENEDEVLRFMENSALLSNLFDIL